MGVSPAMPRIEVWKRTSGHAAETPSAASPISLWRFGLPASALATGTGDTNVFSTSSLPTAEQLLNSTLFASLFLMAVFLLTAVCFFVPSLSQKPTQPGVASTELASCGESNSAYSPSMEVLDAAARGAIGGPHHGPSSTDRMLENQQRQDERQIDKQAAEIEALKKKLEQLKAECKSIAASPDACAW
eukprot:TRINITY_DN3396_c0_g2_i2.p1 TRINITY_DN3396_c0_g2~~TRINITY_DN3396_c0_g2_i2.p1  ORF type:complete len:209 (+),score=37.81 TRINITY_DN3396_c0_g2_i2:64-627(+)